MTQSLPDPPVEHRAARLLAASSSIANVPYNVIADIVDIPYYESLAVEEYAYALGPAGSTGGVPGWIPPGAATAPGGTATINGQTYYAQGGTGSWYMESIGNTWGWDDGNWPQLAALSGFLLPFQFTETIDAQVQTFAQAELIDGAGVNCEFECANLLGYLGGWLSLQTPLASLLSGTTFPTVLADTIGANSSTGVINVGANSPYVIWSGQPAQLNLLAPLAAIAANLTGSPANNPIMLPDPTTLIESVVQLGNELNYDFNPFVQGSFLYWGAPTLYSVPAAIGGLVQSLTGIPNPFVDIGAWQPNGAEPLSGYTAGLPQLVEGLPQGFQYLATGLLDYLSPTLAADLKGPLSALGSLGTVPANLLESTGIAGLWTLATTTLPSALANLNTQVVQALLGAPATGSSATGLSSLLSGMDAASVLTLGNSLLGTGSTGSPSGLSSLLSGLGGASPSGLSSLLSGRGGGSLSTLVNNLSGATSTVPTVSKDVSIKPAPLSSPAPSSPGQSQPNVVQTLDTGSTLIKKPHSTTSPSTNVLSPLKPTSSTVENLPSTPHPSINVTTAPTGSTVTGGTSTNVTGGGNMVKPGQLGDQINKAVSTALGGMHGDSAKVPTHHH